MKDRFQSYTNAATVTPSDTALLQPIPLALWVDAGGGATGIKVDTVGGNIGVTIPLLPTTVATIPLQVTKVYATGTNLGTGGLLVALW